MGTKTESLILGIDLGGTKILAAVVNDRGKIFSHDQSITPAEKGPDAVVKAIVESAKRALDRAGKTSAEIAAVGVGAAGLSNPDTGILFTSPHLPLLRDVPLRDLIEKELGRKTFLTNDANAAALGELRFGAAKGTRNFIYVTISTGIGGGIIINGELYTGAIGVAAEVGHMTIDVNGPPCNCGNRGCWETLASGTAMANEAKRQIKEGARTSILEYAGGDIEGVSAEVIAQAARHGDALAREIIAQTGCYIGVGLANLINIFNPEMIVIGGGLSNIGDMLLEPAYKVAGERSFQAAYRAVRFATAGLGGYSGVLGAAAFALREIAKQSQT